MTAPPTLHVEAHLVLDVDPHAADLPGSWCITHSMGSPAAGTYTEVAIAPGQDHPEAVLEAAARQAAVELYGTAWAFIYRPHQTARAVHRHGMRRRERVVITNVEVWE